MKKLTSLLIGCSLALAGAALAQQPVEQQSPSKKKHAPEKAHPAEAQPKPNAAKPEAPAAKQHGATKEPGAGKGAKAPAHQESATAPKTNGFGESADTSTPTARQKRIEQVQLRQFGQPASKPRELKERGRRRSPIRSMCSKSKRSTLISARSQS